MRAIRSHQIDDNGLSSRDDALPHFWFTPAWACFLSLAITVVFCFTDMIVPRGATVAIGYCAVPAIAAGTRSRRFLFSMAILCTALTWAAYFVEPGDYAWWKSAFDRTMVTAVVWFALLLVLRRVSAIGELTHQKRALKDTTRELERSNSELSKFASVVAHDLRGSLNTVGLFAQLLSTSNSIQADADCQEALDSIQTELTRINRFIESLLLYGRVGAGNLKPQDCDCAAVLSDVRQRLTADLQRNGAQLSNDPLPVLRADPILIAELFQNLIENSLKYRRQVVPRIHISAAQRPDGWLFSVQDNGIGIQPHHYEQIFNPFQQISAGQSAPQGVGLGLATCKQIVERHGGWIQVQSTPGEGTTFLFTLATPSTAATRSGNPMPTDLTDDKIAPVLPATQA